jgi:hypothetical protein
MAQHLPCLVLQFHLHRTLLVHKRVLWALIHPTKFSVHDRGVSSPGSRLQVKSYRKSNYLLMVIKKIRKVLTSGEKQRDRRVSLQVRMNQTAISNMQISPEMPTQTRLLSSRQVAYQLGVCIETVRRYYREGILNGARCGRKILRFRAEDVAALLGKGAS